jgi:hypothetical protein
VIIRVNIDGVYSVCIVPSLSNIFTVTAVHLTEDLSYVQSKADIECFSMRISIVRREDDETPIDQDHEEQIFFDRGVGWCRR